MISVGMGTHVLLNLKMACVPSNQGQEKTIKNLHSLWPEMACFGPFLTRKPTEIVDVGLFCVLSQELRHLNLFLGAHRGFLGGRAKVDVDRIDVLFLSFSNRVDFLKTNQERSSPSRMCLPSDRS